MLASLGEELFTMPSGVICKEISKCIQNLKEETIIGILVTLSRYESNETNAPAVFGQKYVGLQPSLFTSVSRG
jgi:hypothetical protein